MNNLRLLIPIVLLLLTCNKAKEPSNYLFQTLDGKELGIDFQNTVRDQPQMNILQYLYFYNGAGLGAGNFDGDSLVDLFFVSNMGKNGLYLQEQAFEFSNATEAAGLQGKANWQTGVSVIDINNDGWDDLYICAVSGVLGFTGQNELYINQQDGTFKESAAEYGLDIKGYCTQAYFFDYDRDDDLDVFIVKHAVHTESSHGPASNRKKRNEYTGDQLLENQQGRYVDVSEQAGIYGGMNGYGLSASLFDANNDGWTDIYVCNDFHENDYLYINQQNGQFEEQVTNYFSHVSRFSMGSDAADINHDGFADLITLDMLPEEERIIKASDPGVSYQVDTYLRKLGYSAQFSRNMLQINNAGQQFNEMAFFSGLEASDWSWAPLLADFNNDQQLDLFISNGIIKRPNDLDFINFIANVQRSANVMPFIESMPSGKVANKIYEGSAQLQFKDRKNKWMANQASLSNGAIYVDLDNNGQLDLITNNINAAPTVYRNTEKNNQSLHIRLQYKAQNKKGIGAKVILYSNGQQQTRVLNPYRGFMSTVDSRICFGLGQTTKIDSITVIWPDGSQQHFGSFASNQEIELAYSPKAQPFENTSPLKLAQTNLIDYKHQEDQYEDFDRQKLMPYRISNTGPKSAQADVNGDGRIDFIVCGSQGTSAALFVQGADEGFSKRESDFQAEAAYEDTDVAFFDADGDQDQDLLFASGGGVFDCQSTLLKARLYLNNGRGEFRLSKEYDFPTKVNFSCIAAADYDRDGDIDVFLGARASCQAWGVKPDSYVLVNDGSGQLEIAEMKFFKELGFVTDACWVDMDQDEFLELVIAREWAPPIIIANEAGQLSLGQALADSLSGLWQSVEPYDLDGDGQQEVLMGNWGQNNKFASANRLPLQAWFNDFDRNGAKEFIIGYTVEGQIYPVATRDELRQSQTIGFVKKFPNYSSYAKQNMAQVFDQQQLEESDHFSVQTLQSGFLKGGKTNQVTFIPFSPALQKAPIHFFQPLIGSNRIVAGGNKYDLQPFHGILSANPSVFYYDQQKGDLVVENGLAYGIKANDVQLNAALSIPQKSGQILFLFANKGAVQTYQMD